MVTLDSLVNFLLLRHDAEYVFFLSYIDIGLGKVRKGENASYRAEIWWDVGGFN